MVTVAYNRDGVSNLKMWAIVVLVALVVAVCAGAILLSIELLFHGLIAGLAYLGAPIWVVGLVNFTVVCLLTLAFTLPMANMFFKRR